MKDGGSSEINKRRESLGIPDARAVLMLDVLLPHNQDNVLNLYLIFTF
jgi:hypothetical protein